MHLRVVVDEHAVVQRVDVYSVVAATGQVAWTYTLPWWAYGSPAVSDGRVFATGVDGTLAALNARTGGLLWKHKLPYHSLVEAPVGEGRPVLYVAGGLERPYVPPGG
jgi:outer membrane protein assembly factor BamB